MNCHYCGEPLSAFRMRSAGDFCSAEHRRKYQRVARSGLARLAEADEALELVRRKDRPMALLSVVNGAAARRAFAPPEPTPPAPGLPRLEPAAAPRLRPAKPGPARRGGASSGAPRLAAAPVWRRGAQARSRMWILRTAALEVHPKEAGEFLPLPPGRGNCDPAIYPAAAAEFGAPAPSPGEIGWAPLAPGAPFLPPAPRTVVTRPHAAIRVFQAREVERRLPRPAATETARLSGAPPLPAPPEAAAAAASARSAGVAFRLPPLVPEGPALPGIRPRPGR